jgi:hypothetical protein
MNADLKFRISAVRAGEGMKNRPLIGADFNADER